jgi:hypothetical protein
MRRLFAALLLLSLPAVAIPAFAQNGFLLYSNGLPCPDYCHDAWQINGGFVVSDSFVANAANGRVTGFDFYTWQYPGDRVLRIQWMISSAEFGGTVYGLGSTLVDDEGGSMNEYGFFVDTVKVTGLNVEVPAGTSWITLQNAVTAMHDPVYWDENSGADCHWHGCPSIASENQVGTIPSESFDIRGTYMTNDEGKNQAPQPTSSMSWMPFLAGVGAALRRFVL